MKDLFYNILFWFKNSSNFEQDNVIIEKLEGNINLVTDKLEEPKKKKASKKKSSKKRTRKKKAKNKSKVTDK